MSYQITLLGLHFFAYHGVLAAEQRRGQAFFVDVVLDCTGSPPDDDDLAHTVDYAAVYDLVRRVMTGGPYKLLETVGQRVADGILAAFPPVDGVTVTLHKPGAPLPGPVRDVAVTITRQRGGPCRR